MAIHFIHRGGYDMGYHLYTASRDEVMVGIEHRPKDGYRLSHDKQVIKEQLPLREFIERLVRVEEHNESSSQMQSKIERDIYTIVKGLTSRNSGEIRCLGEWLDNRYARLILKKKLSLMQHNYSINVNTVREEVDRGQNLAYDTKFRLKSERETIGNTERSVTQVGWDSAKVMKHMEEQGIYPMTSDKAYGDDMLNTLSVSDKEVYYLLT